MFDDENLAISLAVGTALLILTVIVGTVGAAPERDGTSAGALTISGGWASASLGAVRTSAAYVTIENEGLLDDRLVKVSVDGVPKAALHMHIHEDGQTRMRPVDGVPLRAGKTTALEPGGFHIMLTDLPAPLEAGTILPATLTFERAAPVLVELTVRDRSYKAAAGSKDDGDAPEEETSAGSAKPHEGAH